MFGITFGRSSTNNALPTNALTSVEHDWVKTLSHKYEAHLVSRFTALLDLHGEAIDYLLVDYNVVDLYNSMARAYSVWLDEADYAMLLTTVDLLIAIQLSGHMTAQLVAA